MARGSARGSKREDRFSRPSASPGDEMKETETPNKRRRDATPRTPAPTMQGVGSSSAFNEDPDVVIPEDVLISPISYKRTKASAAFTEVKFDILSHHSELMDRVHELKQDGVKLSSKIDDLNFTLEEARHVIKRNYQAIGTLTTAVHELDSVIRSMWRDFTCLRGNKHGEIVMGIPKNIMDEFWCTLDENLLADQINDSTDREKHAEIEGILLRTEDLKKLTLPSFEGSCSDKWLDDKVVDAFIHHLRLEQPKDSDNYLECSKMFYPLLMSGLEDKPLDSDVGRKYLQKRRIYLPMCVKNHWLLAVIDSYVNEIRVLNSQPTMSREIEEARHLAKGVETQLKSVASPVEAFANGWENLDLSVWNIRIIPRLPKQCDSMSCGLFMLKFIQHWDGFKLKIDFRQEDIDKFRKKLAAVLVNSKKNVLKPVI